MGWNRKLPKDYVELIAYTTWEIRKRRNGVCFEKEQFEPFAVVRRAQVQWHEYVEGRGRRYTRWYPPARGTCKLNCDVAVGKYGTLGCGVVVRDADGNVVVAGKEEIRAEDSSTLLEGYAMRYAMQMAKQYGITAESVERDRKSLGEMMVNGRQKPEEYCDILADEIRSLGRDIGCNNFEYISHDKTTK